MCVNGQEAVHHIINGGAPHIVLMDCQMPILDGYEATKEIRTWERSTNAKRIPILALTANAFAEDSERCIAAGMDDFLAKPISIGALSNALDKWTTGIEEGNAHLTATT